MTPHDRAATSGLGQPPDPTPNRAPQVDSANLHLNSMNKRMKKTLAETRSADRFILDFILLIILLGIVGYIISMV